MEDLIIGIIILAIIILAVWYLHKNWVSFKSGQGGWLSKIVHPLIELWDKIF